MAEQSIGMATTGAGDGTLGGYSSSRMTAMETKTLSDGVLQTGSLLAMTGSGTNTLNIAAGAAIVGGYFYENTTSSAIVISSLANATYNVAILVNATAGALTVSRSVSGTTVLSYTVRLVVATSAQLSGQTYLQLGTVTVTSASISAITPDYTMYGTTTQLPYQSYATMSGGTATLTTAGTTYDVTGYSSPSTTAEAIFSTNTTTGEITVRRAGLYLVNAYGIFSSGTTGNRVIAIVVNGSNTQLTRMASSGTSTHAMTQTSVIVLAASDVVKISVISTLATQSYASGTFTITRA